MAEPIGALRANLSLDWASFEEACNSAGRTVSNFGKSFRRLERDLAPVITVAAEVGAGLGIVAAAVGVVAAEIVKLGSRGADVADVQTAFSNLTARAGETSDMMLGALREGTLGTISNFDLMRLANTALGGGLITSTKDMATLAQGAQLLADRTGTTAKEAFGQLTEALTKGTSKAAELKFMFRDSIPAVAEYAASIGKLPKDLNETELATAKSQGALAALRDELAKNGPATADFGDRVAQVKVAIENFTDQLGVAIATSPPLTAAMDSMAKSIEDAFGGDQSGLIRGVVGEINTFALALVGAGGVAVEVGRAMGLAFEATKLAVGATMATISIATGDAANRLAYLAEKAALIPGMGLVMTPVADKLREIGREAATSAANFNSMGVSGLVGIGTVNRVADAAGLAFERAEVAILSASTKTPEFAGKVEEFIITPLGKVPPKVGEVSRAFEDMGGVSDRVLEAILAGIDPITEAENTLQADILLATTTGIDKILLEVQRKENAEILSAARIKNITAAEYDNLVALITTKYQTLALSAQINFFAPTVMGVQEMARLSDERFNAMAATALSYFNWLGGAAHSVYSQITGWHTSMTNREVVNNGLASKSAADKYAAISNAASTVLRSVFGHSKTAAIAGAIIDTAAAVVTSFRNGGGWPWGLIPAAAMAAAGYAQIQTIRSQDAGFAAGTPGTSFVDFGAATPTVLHGKEAVINQQQGRSLASMLAASIHGASHGPRLPGVVAPATDGAGLSDVASLAELRALRDEQRAFRSALPTVLRDAVMLARA